MDETTGNINKEGKIKRPLSLSILCILTFIGSGSAFISNIFCTLKYDKLPSLLEQMSKNGMKFQDMDMIKDIPRDYYMYDILFTAGSLFGAIEMWKLKRIGFHFYTASQLSEIIISMIFIGVSITSGATFLTVAFILLYAMNLRYMKNKS